MAFEHGYVVVIGVDENNIERLALKTVAKDVQAVHDVLVHPQRCAYKPDNVKLLKGEKSTNKEILDALYWLQERVAEDAEATAVIYYSGHGMVDKATDQYYLIPYDIRSMSRVRADAIKAEELTAEINAIKAKRMLVILDCCHAAGMDVKKIELNAPDVEATAFPIDLPETKDIPILEMEPGDKAVNDLKEGQGRAILNSSTGTQSSYIRTDGKMSLFTYHLIEALTGHAKPADDATVVSVTDVMSWVTHKVKLSAKEQNLDQTPVMRTSGVFPVAQLIGGQGVAKGLGGTPPYPLAPLPSVNIEVGHAEGGVFAGDVSAGGDVAGRDIIKKEGGVHIDGGSNMSGGNFTGGDGKAAEDDYVEKPIAIDINSKGANFGRQAKVMDAATRGEVKVGEATVVLALIRDSGSKGLRELLDLEPDYQLEEEDVRTSRDFRLDFPVDKQENLLPANVEIRISAPNFSPSSLSEMIEVEPYGQEDNEPEPIEFLMTPLISGDLQILIEVFQFSGGNHKKVRSKPLRTISRVNPSPYAKPHVISLMFDLVSVNHLGDINTEGGDVAGRDIINKEGSIHIDGEFNMSGGNFAGGDGKIVEGDEVHGNVDKSTTTFNQEGQKVEGNQINAGGNVNVEHMGNKTVNEGDTVYGDKVGGDKVGGDKISVGNVSGTGIAIGSGAQANVTQGVSGAELNQLFAPLLQQMAQQNPAVIPQVNELKEEASKGDDADDDKMANLISDIAEAAPTAVEGIVNLFTNSIIAKVAGAATKFVVGRLQK
ncbi:caspase family protein [Candidatus Leptofilum sp.]|uniref:caspase family protein n=1 Tax=Candidatus Leptofilum sp. TaxID=3241576 RepID=UPI003B5C06D1